MQPSRPIPTTRRTTKSTPTLEETSYTVCDFAEEEATMVTTEAEPVKKDNGMTARRLTREQADPTTATDEEEDEVTVITRASTGNATWQITYRQPADRTPAKSTSSLMATRNATEAGCRIS
jgi:uncharacterized Zn finger protein (UPF0148 family)